MNYGSDGLRRQFLGECCRDKVSVTLFLMNGFQLKGFILGFDENVLVMCTREGKQNMIYRHAVSTIVPDVPVALQ